MRKQVDFDVRVFPLGNGAGESMTRQAVGAIIRDEYMKKGWEVFHVDTNQVSAGVIYYQVTLVKYEEVVTAGLTFVDSNPDTNTLNVKSK